MGRGVGSPSRHERRTARLSASSLAVSDCTGPGVLGEELLREGEGDCTLGEGVRCLVVDRMVWMKSSMEVGDLGMMVLRLWRGIGGAGVEGGRHGEDIVAVPEVVRQVLEESVRICGGVGGGVGGGRSLRKFLMISWVGSIGLSSSGEPGGELSLLSFREILGLGPLWWVTADG